MTETPKRKLLRRPTAVGLALAAAAAQAGMEVPDHVLDGTSLPQKREPAWSVTRREKRPRRK